jgi:RES domain-containing protein
MIVYRLCKKTYANDISGRGAEISGGRWNGKGTAMVYTSASLALCLVEIMVHIPAGIIPKDYNLVSISIPDNAHTLTIERSDLPDNWNRNPIPASAQKIGNAFIAAQEALVLKVPSTIVQEEWNYLINPSHKDFKKIKITTTEPFSFDTRLFNK